MLCLGVASYGVAMVVTGSIMPGITLFLLGVVGVLQMRPHVALVAFFGVLLAALVGRARRPGVASERAPRRAVRSARGPRRHPLPVDVVVLRRREHRPGGRGQHGVRGGRGPHERSRIVVRAGDRGIEPGEVPARRRHRAVPTVPLRGGECRRGVDRARGCLPHLPDGQGVGAIAIARPDDAPKSVRRVLPRRGPDVHLCVLGAVELRDSRPSARAGAAVLPRVALPAPVGAGGGCTTEEALAERDSAAPEIRDDRPPPVYSDLEGPTDPYAELAAGADPYERFLPGPPTR